MTNNCWKSTIKYGKKVETLLDTKFDSKPVYCDNNKYIKTKIKIYGGSVNTIFKVKKCQNKKHHAKLYQR